MSSTREETPIQIECVQYMRNELRVPYGTFFSVPNEGKRSYKLASIMKAKGLLSGVPDLIWLVNKTVVFFEMKREKGGSLSAKQKLVKANLIEEGYEVHVVNSVDDFKKIVNSKLK